MGASLCFFHQLATPVDLSGLALGVWGSGALVATLGFLSGDPLLSNYLGAVALGLGELKSSDEGEVFWVDRKALANYTLAPDMEAMVQVMESESLSEFYYYKENGSWKYKLQ